jgi:nucleoside-triphosphatase
MELKNILVTGIPGVGKTTVLMKLLKELGELDAAGFCTREIREGRKRKGFELVGLNGEKMILAHVNIKSTHRVGSYGVDVEGFDAMLDSLDLAGSRAEIVLVDEIGKMECFSRKFISTIESLLDAERMLVATVAARGSGFIEDVKRRPDCEIFVVTRENRTELPGELARRIRSPRLRDR